MKEKIVGFVSFLMLAFLLCSFSTSAARLLLQNHGEKEFKAKEMVVQAATLLKDTKDDFSNLIGSDSTEECYEKDEECLKRRMIAEAHLDYIYTQNHKP